MAPTILPVSTNYGVINVSPYSLLNGLQRMNNKSLLQMERDYRIIVDSGSVQPFAIKDRKN